MMALPEVETFLNELEALLTRHLDALKLDMEEMEGREHVMVGDWAIVVQLIDLEDSDESWTETYSPTRMHYHHHLGLLVQATDDMRDGSGAD